MILIGLDDTDVLESRGTGHLARDPRVPCTKNNSCAAILLNGHGTPDLAALFAQVKAWMLADFQEGSDPGLCVAALPVAAALAGAIGHLGKFVVKWVLGVLTGAPLGFVALGLAWSLVNYVAWGALGGILGALTLKALRKAGFFAYLAEKR